MPLFHDLGARILQWHGLHRQSYKHFPMEIVPLASRPSTSVARMCPPGYRGSPQQETEKISLSLDENQQSRPYRHLQVPRAELIPEHVGVQANCYVQT
ncbi:8-amino-7-oxononanoate synthase [Moniliophthora roreri]|nr:8-amino-7-oxononanoate synthase [Moniliophthora roreri]